MPEIVIKDLPQELRRKLKARAARHHRSMAREALALLEQALGPLEPGQKAPPAFEGRFPLTDRFLDRAKREGRM